MDLYKLTDELRSLVVLHVINFLVTIAFVSIPYITANAKPTSPNVEGAALSTEMESPKIPLMLASSCSAALCATTLLASVRVCTS